MSVHGVTQSSTATPTKRLSARSAGSTFRGGVTKQDTDLIEEVRKACESFRKQDFESIDKFQQGQTIFYTTVTADNVLRILNVLKKKIERLERENCEDEVES